MRPAIFDEPFQIRSVKYLYAPISLSLIHISYVHAFLPANVRLPGQEAPQPLPAKRRWRLATLALIGIGGLTAPTIANNYYPHNKIA